jgi:N-acetylglucosamine kinase-like BadF-type ATPase
MYVVGVDGGTTKTIALVADEQGDILAAARGKGSNWSGEDVQVPMTVVAETVREALAKAGVSADAVTVGVFTLAGADWPEDHTRREEFLRTTGIASRVIVKNDSFGGLRAGLSRPYGMVLALGTGFNAAVITPTGEEWAFGYYETTGGASTIINRAVEALMREEDGRGLPTELTRMILERMEYPTTEALLRDVVLRRFNRARYYSITPLVFEAAYAGDPVAVEIIAGIGKELAEYIQTMARRFHMGALEFEVVLAGSVFKGVGPLLTDTLAALIHRDAPKAKIVRAKFEPAVGSVLLAYDAFGLQVTDDIYARLAETVPGAEFFDTAGGIRPTSMHNPEVEEEDA